MTTPQNPRGRSRGLVSMPLENMDAPEWAQALEARLLSLVEQLSVQPDYLPVEDAARLISVPASWLAEQARQKRVPVRMFGRYPRFPRGELLAWAEARIEGPRVGRTGSHPVSRSTGGQR